MSLKNLHRDFISKEERRFKFMIGKTLASSLTGFVAGVVFASIFWGAIFYFYSLETVL
ncbi:MAG: hypothetical protein PHZ25_00360 [Candidatus Pacebacteria bacterium]|nr:hypothetical protein [Candidatus Paceibacterota bacterium]